MKKQIITVDLGLVDYKTAWDVQRNAFQLRQDGSIDNEIGWDFSSGVLYRPFLNNNVQFRFGVSALLPGKGLTNLYGNQTLYDAFTNLIFAY